jgi:hypothetical protein
MARRDLGHLTRERLVQMILSLGLALWGCGRSSMDVYPSDPGPDGTAGIFGGAGGAPGDGAVAGGSQSMSGTASLVAGASGGAGWTTGGASATGGASTLVFGGSSAGLATGGTSRTGGLSGTAGRGGLSTAGTTRTGGTTGTGGVTGTGGTAGRTVTGGSSVGGTTATRTGGTTGGSKTTGGTTGGSKTTGGTTGSGGTNATGGGSGGSSGSGLTTSGGAGGGTGGMGGSGGSTAAALLQPLIEAFCTAAKSCCARANYPVANLSDCEAQFPSRLDIYPLVDKGTVFVDQQALADCVSAYKNAATTCTINLVKTACKGVFAGLQVEGQPCGGSNQFGASECKPVNGSATCYRPQGDVDPKSVGSCVNIPRGKSGDACSMTCQVGKTCIVDMLGGTSPFPTVCFEEDGLFCSLAANPTVCKPILKTGDPCRWEGNSCGAGNFCSWPNSTCAPAAKLGESCVDRACIDDLICANSRKCAELPLASDSVCKGTPSTP